MNDDQQESANQTEAAESSVESEAVEAAPEVVAEVRGRSEHTAKAAENQDKTHDTVPDLATIRPPNPPVPGMTKAELALRQRIRAIEALLIEKESYQMAHVFQKIPFPYYKQWKDEANEIVALIVSLKHRAAEMRKRNAS